MPKATIPPLPLEGIFAIVKPSGPTTMSIVTRLKPLFSSSRLFVNEEKLRSLSSKAIRNMKEKYPGPTKKGELTGKDRNKGKSKREKTNWKQLSKQYVKIGSGGTLDPLADGVLIIGIGSGTKHLSQFLNCKKTYRTTGLLGCETDSYDSEGAVARFAPWRHVTKDLIVQNLEQFRGNIKQTPPIFSALKVDGKPLYEYARQGEPLPRPIEARGVTISKLELAGFTMSTISSSARSMNVSRSGHSFQFPEKRLTQVERDERRKVLELVNSDPSSAQVAEIEGNFLLSEENLDTGTSPQEEGQRSPSNLDAIQVNRPASSVAGEDEEMPPVFELEMTVSSGTYVRSVVHDLGISVGSAAHVVVLTRTRQGQFVLGQPGVNAHGSTQSDAGSIIEGNITTPNGDPCVDWSILEDALNRWESGQDIDVDAEGWAEWELEILRKWPEQTKLDLEPPS